MKKPRSLKYRNTSFDIAEIKELNWETRQNESRGIGVNGPNLYCADPKQLRKLAKWLLQAAKYIEGKKRG